MLKQKIFTTVKTSKNYMVDDTLKPFAYLQKKKNNRI